MATVEPGKVLGRVVLLREFGFGSRCHPYAPHPVIGRIPSLTTWTMTMTLLPPLVLDVNSARSGWT